MGLIGAVVRQFESTSNQGIGQGFFYKYVIIGRREKGRGRREKGGERSLPRPKCLGDKKYS
jgi:hypothetical protein